MKRLFASAFLSISMLSTGSLATGIITLASGSANGQEKASQEDAAAQYQRIVDRCVDYLRVRGQADDGSFSASTGIGPTGLVVSGLLSVGVSPNDPMLAKALDYLQAQAQADGGIYRPDSLHRNYDTCIAMVALSQANQQASTRRSLKKPKPLSKASSGTKARARSPATCFMAGLVMAPTLDPIC